MSTNIDYAILSGPSVIIRLEKTSSINSLQAAGKAFIAFILNIE